jgi:urocanate hydratase
MTFQEQIQQEFLGFTKTKPYETDINHAPKRKEILSSEENWHWHAMPYGILNRNITLLIQEAEELEPTDAFTCTVCVLIMKCVRVN